MLVGIVSTFRDTIRDGADSRVYLVLAQVLYLYSRAEGTVFMRDVSGLVNGS